MRGNRNSKYSLNCYSLCFVMLVGLLFLAIPAGSQTVGGAVRGTVTDQTSAVIANVEVSIANVTTGVVTKVSTNSAGFYNAPTLLPGTYNVTATVSGFKTEVRAGITVSVGASEVVNLQMKVGDTSDKIVVTAGATSVELASSTLSNVVVAKDIVELPLNGRDWTQLALLQPGVVQTQGQVGSLGGPSAPGGRTVRGNGVQMDISGGRPQENNYRLDGINIDDYANSAPGSILGFNLGADAVEEFSVLTSNFSAQYGRGSGGVINAVTRSGDNGFHGDVYEFLRNSALDASNLFDFGKRPPLKRNQFGASAGGPIQKNKTFFFGDYEGFRQNQGFTTLDFVPTANARQGILSTGNVTVDPAVVPYLALWPLPNEPVNPNDSPDVGRFSIAAPQIESENYAIGRIDHLFSTSDNLDGTYLFDTGNISSPDEFNNKPNLLRSRRHVFSLAENHIFTPNVVNSARIGLSRTFASHGIITEVNNPLLKDPALGFIPNHDIGLIGVTGITGFSGGLGNDDGDVYYYTSIQAYDDLYITKGIHGIKIGANVERIRLNENSPSAEEGDWEFNSLPDFLTNQPFTFNGAIPPSDTYYGLRQTVVGAYILDDVRLRPNFTLNLGLRYEAATIVNEVHGRSGPLFQVTDPTPTIGPFFQSNPTLRNFEPRVGFAWDPFGDGKTSVRSGFGMFDILPLPYLFHQITNSAPFFQGGEIGGGATPIPQGSFPKQGFPLLGPTSNQGWYTPAHPPRAYKMQWNLNVQRELTPSTTLTVAYTGSRGVHLVWHNAWINTVISQDTPQGFIFPVNGTPLNPNFGRINALIFQSNSFYHGLQIGLNQKLSHGLQAHVSYTWSKSIDDSSSSFDAEEFNNSVNDPLPFNVRYNRGVSDFNVPRNLVANLIWDVPVPASHAGPVNWLTQGWQMGGILIAQDGTPFTALVAGDAAGSLMATHAFQRPIFNDIPGCTPNAINPGNVNHYIKTQCFLPPSPHIISHSTVGRNTLIGPGELNLDLSAFKNFNVPRISETFKVQFRAEAFNALNRANLQPPYSNNVIFDPGNNNNLVPQVGAIQGTQTTARQIQFGLKVIW